MHNFLLTAYEKGGLTFALICSVLLILYLILRHFLDQNKSIFEALERRDEQNHIREVEWRKTVSEITAQSHQLSMGWQKVLDAHNAAAVEYHTRSAEANRFQREEHLDMSQNLTIIKETFVAAHNQRAAENQHVISKLNEICKIVEACPQAK